MCIDISHRDNFGFLRGSFDQGGMSYPIVVLEDITPFLFPCQNCNLLVFHVAAEQSAGLGIKLPFMSQPLISTSKGYYALCNACTTVNSQLTDEMVRFLRNNTLPAQIRNLFPQICKAGMPTPYSEKFIDGWVESVAADPPCLRQRIRSTLNCYALINDKESLVNQPVTSNTDSRNTANVAREDCEVSMIAEPSIAKSKASSVDPAARHEELPRSALANESTPSSAVKNPRQSAEQDFSQNEKSQGSFVWHFLLPFISFLGVVGAIAVLRDFSWNTQSETDRGKHQDAKKTLVKDESKKSLALPLLKSNASSLYTPNPRDDLKETDFVWVVPRHVEGFKLGMTRTDFKKSLPESPQLVEREIPGGYMAALLGASPANNAVAREWFARFDGDKLVELRIRYFDLPTNEPGTFLKKLHGYKAALGTPEISVPSSDSWSDMPRRGASQTLTWQDDVSQFSCYEEPFRLEVTLKSRRAEDEAGTPLWPIEYLDRGAAVVSLGMSKDALVKFGAQPSEGDAYLLECMNRNDYDAIFAWVENGSVSRIVARHKLPFKTEEQASRAILEKWARDARTLGWPNRQDILNQRLQSLATRDDRTRFRLFWQEGLFGVIVFSEWKDVK